MTKAERSRLDVLEMRLKEARDEAAALREPVGPESKIVVDPSAAMWGSLSYQVRATATVRFHLTDGWVDVRLKDGLLMLQAQRGIAFLPRAANCANVRFLED